jgi:hypothetical protein
MASVFAVAWFLQQLVFRYGSFEVSSRSAAKAPALLKVPARPQAFLP